MVIGHWSVAQGESNGEKNGGRKSRWNFPLIAVLYIYNTNKEKDPHVITNPGIIGYREFTNSI